MKCPECGNTIDDGLNTCPECGAGIGTQTSQPNLQKAYACTKCGEELEYITTYKQWYCYTCQTYADLPPPDERKIEIGKPLKPEDEPNLKLETEIEEEFDEGNNFTWDDEVKGKNEEENQNKLEEEYADEVDEEYEDEVDEAYDDDDEEGEIEFEVDDNSDLELDSDQESEVSEESEDSEENHILDAEMESGTNKPEQFQSESDLGESVIVDYEEVEIEEKEGSIELGESSIEDNPDIELEVELYEDELVAEDYLPKLEEKIRVTGKENDVELRIKALSKLHHAWIKVNKLKELSPNDPRILELETELRAAIKGEIEPIDGLVLADESMEDAIKIEKELKENIHIKVDDLYHFINSKIILARKIGFNVTELENKMDDISSIIARGEYLKANNELMLCLNEIKTLPITQSEILIGLEVREELIKELLEPISTGQKV